MNRLSESIGHALSEFQVSLSCDVAELPTLTTVVFKASGIVDIRLQGSRLESHVVTIQAQALAIQAQVRDQCARSELSATERGKHFVSSKCDKKVPTEACCEAGG